MGRVAEAGKTVEIDEKRVRAEGRSVNEQALAPLGALAAPSPYSVTLLGKMKSGKNRILTTRTGHRYPPKSFKVWRDEMLATMPRVDRPFVGPVALIVDYVPGDEIRRDAPGILDALCHLLERAGILLDDAQVQEVHWLQHPIDRRRPYCRILVKP